MLDADTLNHTNKCNNMIDCDAIFSSYTAVWTRRTAAYATVRYGLSYVCCTANVETTSSDSRADGRGNTEEGKKREETRRGKREGAPAQLSRDDSRQEAVVDATHMIVIMITAQHSTAMRASITRVQLAQRRRRRHGT
jgi:hypothetical protein